MSTQLDPSPATSSGQRLFTVADLAAMPTSLPSGDVDFELDDGRLVARVPPGNSHGAAQMNVAAELKNQGVRGGWGKARTEVGVVLWRSPDRVVVPDALFVAQKGLPLVESSEGYLETIPDLVVEVRSKNDSDAEVAHKVGDYLRAGVGVVWVLDTSRRSVVVHRPNAAEQLLVESDTLTIEDVIPGFRVVVRDLFEE